MEDCKDFKSKEEFNACIVGKRIANNEKCDVKRIKELVDNSMIDVHLTDGEIMGVGLKYGESKRLEKEGFSRKEQIKILDCLQDNPELAKELLGV